MMDHRGQTDLATVEILWEVCDYQLLVAGADNTIVFNI